MLHNTNAIIGFEIKATDGSVGHLEDVIFHERTWRVPYLVVDTGPWILGRQLLFSPNYVESIDQEKESIQLALRRDQIKQSPEKDADLPISELKEREFDQYKKGPVFWSGSGERKDSKPPGAMPAVEEEAEAEKQEVERELYGKHLRSAAEVEGYRALATDSALGLVSGILIDTDEWIVRYFVLSDEDRDRQNVQIYSPDWIDTIRWIERSIHVKYSYDVASGAPPLESDAMVDREYEKKLYDYYETEGS